MATSDNQVHLNKSQSLAIALAIINCIDTFCEERSEEFQEFLKSEEKKNKNQK